MTQESVVYAINLMIGAILAVLLTQHWRLAGRESSLGHWMAAAWTMTAADLLFALRPELPYWVGRFFPTLLVTVGQVILLRWTMQVAGRKSGLRTSAAIVAVHGVALATFLLVGNTSSWRTVANGVLWATLSIASYGFLRRASAPTRSTLALSAFVFLAHGLFHLVRLTWATAAAVQNDAGSVPWLNTIGDVEVSLFIVALYVSLLVAHLQQRNEQLRSALADVQTLSELLPLCAWCRKVRSDDGYWQKLETYFSLRRKVQFTHGICDACQAEQFGGGAS